MSVLFTHSYFYKFDPKQWGFKQPYPPLGTIQAAAVIREAGFAVSLFDTNLRDDHHELAATIRQHAARYLIIYDDGFNYLTKMCLTNMREAAFEMAKTAKRLGCVVIVSSSDAADHYEKYFAHAVDFVIKGEGEQTLKELLHALETRGEVSQISGLVFRKSGASVVTAARAVLKDLDTLPLPAWDLVDIPAYKKIWKKYHGYFSLNIATTRGCPFKCNWCAKPIYGNRYNSRSPEHVLREIEWLIHEYQVEHFWMCDDIFGLRPGWIQEFKTLVLKNELHFRYKIQSRVDLLLEPEVIDALAVSGVETVWVGAESGSQKILDAMDKGTTVPQIREATQLLQEKNIRVAFFVQFGYIGETRQDIDQTINMVLELLPDEVGISVSYPLPGTKFYDKVKDQLTDKQNWTDSDDLAMMFKSTFTPEYYRHLHRYVHSIYRKHKGYRTIKRILGNPLHLSYRDLRTSLATFYFIPRAFAQKIKLKTLESM